MDREQFSSLLAAAAYVEDSYRPRVKYIIERLEPRSAAFDLVRQVLERIEPHFDGLAAFNAAFAGPAATIHAFWGADIQHLGTPQKWRVLRDLVTGTCPDPILSAEEQLSRMMKAKGETWLDFVDRYRAACIVTTASRQNQVKTLYRKLPASLKRWLFSLPSTATVSDMTNALRHASFWESSGQQRAEVEDDPMDVDMATVEVNAATDGKVVGSDGSINFSAITNAGRVMVGAREICKTSRREAQNMLRFLQKICGNNGQGGARRPTNQQRGWGGRRAYVAENSAPEGSGEPIAETISENGQDEDEQSVLLARMAATATKCKEKRRVMKMGLVAQSYLGYPRRIDAMIDTGAESSIVSLALAKELGVEVKADGTKLVLAHGETTKVTGKCDIDVAVERANHRRFTLSCLVLPKPGYDLLLGIDAMTENQISAHPHSRTICIKGQPVKCLFAGQRADKETANEVLHDEVAKFTERVEHLPGLKGDRIQIPLNRSVVLGPKECRMVKTPIVVPRGLVNKRTPVVAPHFSVHLGVQYDRFTTMTLTNHNQEPIRITGKTTVFEIPAATGIDQVILDDHGKRHQLKGPRRSFPRRQ